MPSGRRLVVPLTGSPQPERVLETVCGLAGDDASVIAVVVIEVSPLLPLDAQLGDEEAGARTLLARARTVADSCGVGFVPRIVRARKAVPALLELAAEEDAEIVIVESSGHHLRRSERQLVRKAPDRVLVVAA
jgi:nucleotide-binding universal stress UspA family protein